MKNQEQVERIQALMRELEEKAPTAANAIKYAFSVGMTDATETPRYFDTLERELKSALAACHTF